MNSTFAQGSIRAAKEIWLDWSATQDATEEHVVPFCTPIIPSPDVVIVGLNYARGTTCLTNNRIGKVFK